LGLWPVVSFVVTSEKVMSLEYIISALIALALLAYLVYAMLKPEKF
jgi:K+-transporting ATPase KdpF subunit